MYKGLTICAIIPAFNEAPAIGKVVTELLAISDDNTARVIDEIIVCDNASVDNTAQVASTAGARVVHQPVPGYGIACLTALQARAATDVVLFVDGDDSCFPVQALRLLDGIAAGDDVAIGSRALGNRERGALTPVQEFGNRLSAFLIRMLWNAQVTDLGPFRAVRSSALAMVNMEDKAFGWTVELQVKALQLGLQMNEYAVDSKVRIGESKISGTLKGSVLAGAGILGKIFSLRLQQQSIRSAAGLKKQ